MSCGAAVYSSIFIRAKCFMCPSCVGFVGAAVVVKPITVGILVGRNFPWLHSLPAWQWVGVGPGVTDSGAQQGLGLVFPHCGCVWALVWLITRMRAWDLVLAHWQVGPSSRETAAGFFVGAPLVLCLWWAGPHPYVAGFMTQGFLDWCWPAGGQVSPWCW